MGFTAPDPGRVPERTLCLHPKKWCDLKTCAGKNVATNKLQPKFFVPYQVVDVFDIYISYLIERSSCPSLQIECRLKSYRFCHTCAGKAATAVKPRRKKLFRGGTSDPSLRAYTSTYWSTISDTTRTKSHNRKNQTKCRSYSS